MWSKSKKRQDILALDIGSSKICANLATLNADKVEFLQNCSRPSLGIQKGIITDVSKASNAIKEVVEILFGNSPSHRDVYVSLASPQIKVLQTSGSINIAGKTIEQSDIIRLFDTVSACSVPSNQKKLHAIASDFIIDGKEHVFDPVGMQADSLEVSMSIVLADAQSIDNLTTALSEAGLNLSEIVYEPIASAEAVLTAEERQLRCLLIDIGYGCTSTAVFDKGRLKHAFGVGVAGQNFTRDLSIVLDIEHEEAETLKKQHATTLRHEAGQSVVTVKGKDGQPKHIETDLVSEIIQARAEELFELIKQNLTSQMTNSLDIAVLTGGGSALRGIINTAEAQLKIPARLGDTSQIEGLTNDLYQPAYSASVGLALYAIKTLGKQESTPKKTGFLQRLRGMFK